MKKGVVVFLSLFLLFLLSLPFWPSELDAVSWLPPEPPVMTGVLTPNTALQKAELMARGEIHGPEDVVLDAQGRIYSGLEDGRIIRLENGKVETLANTGGRPLGLAFDAAGNLVICDSAKGLLRLSPKGKLETLLTAVNGVPLNFTDELVIARDGKIYFTDASTKYGQPDYVVDFLEGRPYGRLYVYDPATGKAELLLKNLYFANGVALSMNEDALFVAETYRYRLRKLWLSGEKSGQNEIVADNLPGMPDNIASDGQGTIWIALPSPRKPIADFSARHGWLRNIMFRLPRSLWPKPEHYGLVVAVDESGKLLRSLHDPSGEHLNMITSVVPHEGRLYFGSLSNDRIGRLQ